MTGIHIVKHAIQMVVRNFYLILKLSLLPAIFYAVLFTIGSRKVAVVIGGEGPAPSDLLLGLALILIALGCFVWAVINWHRFVLLEEVPNGWLNFPKIDRIVAYVGYCLLLTFILGLIGAVVGFFVSAVITVLGMLFSFHSPGLPTAAALVVALFVCAVVSCRLSLILPSSAIGKQLSLREAWAATSGATGAILIMLLCIGVLQFGSQILLQSVLINYLSGAFLVLRFAVEACFGVLWVSIMTTLYGHYVQGRPLSS